MPAGQSEDGTGDQRHSGVSRDAPVSSVRLRFPSVACFSHVSQTPPQPPRSRCSRHLRARAGCPSGCLDSATQLLRGGISSSRWGQGLTTGPHRARCHRCGCASGEIYAPGWQWAPSGASRGAVTGEPRPGGNAEGHAQALSHSQEAPTSLPPHPHPLRTLRHEGSHEGRKTRRV